MITLLLAAPAFAVPVAVSCSSGQAPAAYSSASCSSVCTTAGSTTYTITCFPPGTSQGIELYSVEDYAGTGARNYSAWGTDGSGTNFCCFIADSGHVVDRVILDGGDLGDEIDASYSSRNITHANTTLEGFNGADNVFGSDSSSCVDTIFGDQQGDTIDGNGGNDSIHGGIDADVIRAGAGDDTVDAGSGNDSVDGGGGVDTVSGGDNDDDLWGGADDDVVNGDDGDDKVRGGDGNDVVSGNVGADIVCGNGTAGSGNDTLYGSTLGVAACVGINLCDNETLYEPSASNAPSGGTGNIDGGNHCGNTSFTSGWAGTCTYDLTSVTACAANPP